MQLCFLEKLPMEKCWLACRFPLKAVKVMHIVSLWTEATITAEEMPSNFGKAFKNHLSGMFAYHATMMSNNLGISTVVFTRAGFTAILLGHYRLFWNHICLH